MDYGFEAADFEIRAALDLDQDSCETLRRNRASRGWRILEGPITEFATEAILKAAKLRVGQADVLIAGPPCQPFSKSGYWFRGDSGRLADPRAHTLEAFLRVLDEARPRAFLLENVRGIAYSLRDEGYRYLLDEIRRINKRRGTKYDPIPSVLNAASYGVPQLRERFFLVAARDGRKFRFPPPTHANGGTSGLLPFRTAWDAIGDLENAIPLGDSIAAEGKWAGLLPSIPEGENYLWHTDRGGGLRLFGWRRRYWSFLLKLAKNRPSWTIQAQPGPAVGPFHWKNRRLTVRELCRIQTFPEDVIIHGTRASAQRQIGNAVPSLLAEILAREIASQLLDLSVSPVATLMPPDRCPAPSPERVRPVAARYRPLEANHLPHPGTGKGPGAQRRLAS